MNFEHDFAGLTLRTNHHELHVFEAVAAVHSIVLPDTGAMLTVNSASQGEVSLAATQPTQATTHKNKQRAIIIQARCPTMLGVYGRTAALEESRGVQEAEGSLALLKPTRVCLQP